jgi:hypothetical protein
MGLLQHTPSRAYAWTSGGGVPQPGGGAPQWQGLHHFSQLVDKASTHENPVMRKLSLSVLGSVQVGAA